MRPLVAASVALVAGTALGAWLPQAAGAWGWASLALVAAWAALVAGGAAAAGSRAGLALFMLLGVYRCQSALAPLYAGGDPLEEGDVVVRARVARPAELRDGEVVLHAESVLLRRDGATFRLADPLQVLVAGDGGRYEVGDLIVARGRLRAIRGDRNLGWFPGPVAAAGRRYAARLAVGAPVWVRRTGSDPGTGPGAAVLRWRGAADRFWKLRPGAAAQILNALTTGERAGIPEPVQEQFLRAGLTHLLAISGMNVGFLAAAVFLGWRRLLGLCAPLVLRVPAQPLAALLALPALWFFLLFSGSQLPVERAVISGAAVLAAVVASRRVAPGDACALAALTIVALDPRALFSASFQLSFAAVAGLVLAAPRLALAGPPECPDAVGRLRRGARSLLVLSLAASAATAPLVAFHFQQISLVGPLANLLAVPFAGLVVLPAAWLTLAAASVSAGAGELFAQAAECASGGLIAIAGWFALPEWAALRSARPPLLLALSLLALALALLPPPSRRLLKALVAACVAGTLSGGWWAIGTHRERLLVAVLDVGQGLSALLLLPGGRSLLFDAGPQWRGYDAGERVVVPALRRLGIWRLDVLVISHGHPDHCGGAAAVRRALGGGDLGGARDGRPPARGGTRALGGGVRLRVLNPPDHGGGGAGADTNDRSLALLLAWREAGVALTGDAGPRVARGIAAAAVPAPAHLLLQAPHHGGSPEACGILADALRPEVTVVPVGRNAFGHPRPGAVAALAEHGPVRRSDLEGAVFAVSRGGAFSVRSWRELSRERSWGERVRWLGEGW